MLESNSARPLFEALPGEAGQAKHWPLAVQTWAPDPEPQQDLQFRHRRQRKVEQLLAVSGCPGKSPHYRSQSKKSSSGKGDVVPEAFREPRNKGTSTTDGFEQWVALPLVAKPQVP